MGGMFVEDWKEPLLNAARDQRAFAYVPYSHFRVGAALLAKSGVIYRGSNVENASFGATNCAERSAFFAAVSAGERAFTAIAIAGDTKEFLPPCGICRQVMLEFCDPDTFLVLLTNQGGEVRTLTLAELLPYSFGKGNLACASAT